MSLLSSIFGRGAGTALLVAAAAAGWVACGQDKSNLTSPLDQAQARHEVIAAAIAAQDRHTSSLLGIPGVVGTGTALDANGEVVLRVFTESQGVAGIPTNLDGFPVSTRVTGRVVAYQDPTSRFARPVPIGVSTGHPDVTAGTIGARVRNAAGDVFALSNNHIYANQNNANLDDSALQPGDADGGVDPADRIGGLADFEPIDFDGGDNVMDAAIAQSTTEMLGFATTAEGYGAPASTIFGDGNGDGFFDNKNDLLNLSVQKSGRTTGLTQGTVAEINVTVEVCYQPFLFFCFSSAIFVDQLGISPGSFSDGGDSGSLIVTNDEARQPVGLLFAGGSNRTFANRIDLVLNRFGVTIDGGVTAAATDIAVTAVSAPNTAVQGDVVSVDVTVENVGNQDVTNDITVTLNDDTDAVAIGSETINGGLAAGGSTTLTYSWNTATASVGDHTLAASQSFADDDAGNDSNSTVVTVQAALTDIAVTGVSAPNAVVQGDVVSVDVTVENVGNQDVASDITVALDDVTDGVGIGTQTIVGGLAAGGSTTLTYSWNTASASAGDHTLTASQDFADDDAGNDSNNAVVTVQAALTDIAVTTVSAPSSAVQGDVVSVDVTVENVGNQDVASDIPVTLDDITDGVEIGSQTIVGGLGAGAATTLTYSWDTGASSLGDHTLTATQGLADDNGGNDASSASVTVTEAPSSDITLSASGGTFFSFKFATLEWAGAQSASVDVYRNGAQIATTGNDGSYTDFIGGGGGTSFTYVVCEAGTSVCSNEATVTF